MQTYKNTFLQRQVAHWGERSDRLTKITGNVVLEALGLASCRPSSQAYNVKISGYHHRAGALLAPDPVCSLQPLHFELHLKSDYNYNQNPTGAEESDIETMSSSTVLATPPQGTSRPKAAPLGWHGA